MQGYNTGYAYRGMELLQPSVDTANTNHESAKKYHSSEKKIRKSDKQSTPTKVTRFQSDVSSMLGKEVSLQFPSKFSSEVSADVTDYPVKENKSPDASVIKPTVRQEQKSANVHSMDFSPVIDNEWQFLSDKLPHEEITVASSDQVRLK